MVLGQKIVLSLFLSIFSFPHTDTLSLSLSPFTISFLFSPSSSTSFLISVLRYALMPVSLPFLPSLLSIFSLFSPSFFPPFSIQFLSSYQIDLEKGKYTVCLSSNLSLSLTLSLSLYTHAPPTLSLPLIYLISLPHEIRNVVFSFFFHRRKGSGRLRSSQRKIQREEEALRFSRNPVLLSPSPQRIFPKTGDEKKNPFPSLPFFFFILTSNVSLSFLANHSISIVFFLFFLNQSIYE